MFAEIPLFSDSLKQWVPQWDEVVLRNHFLVFSVCLKFLFEFSQVLLARRFWNIFSKYVNIFLQFESFKSYLKKCFRKGMPCLQTTFQKTIPHDNLFPDENYISLHYSSLYSTVLLSAWFFQGNCYFRFNAKEIQYHTCFSEHYIATLGFLHALAFYILKVKSVKVMDTWALAKAF